MPDNPFSSATLTFLRDLATHNDRAWFKANKTRYEDAVLEPAFAFISAIGPRLDAISEHFLAIPRATKGSLFRIHRDTRFSKDKRPYKTHTGIHFRHAASGDVHAPGYYLHIEPGSCFMGVGIWHPDRESLARIRDAIVAHPERWRTVKRDPAFGQTYNLVGDALQRAPRGYDKDHALIDDLKRKDFMGGCDLTDDEVVAPAFIDRFIQRCAAGTPLMRFLCDAAGVPF